MFKSDIGIKEIKRRIKSFRARKKEKCLGEDVTNELMHIFGSQHQIPCIRQTLSTGQVFFRAREIPDHDDSIPFKTISNISDAWEPPSKFVKCQGRLNKINQSILYCCPGDPFLAIEEARASNNQFVAIMKYHSTRQVNITVLGNYINSPLPKDKLTKLFYSFLEKEFSQDVPPGEEDLYVITQSAADAYANYPNQDAWCYRSIQSPKKFNVAFLPNMQKQCLKLEGVMICDIKKSKADRLSVISIVDFDPKTGMAQYHSIGSKRQKELFPEIK